MIFMIHTNSQQAQERERERRESESSDSLLLTPEAFRGKKSMILLQNFNHQFKK